MLFSQDPKPFDIVNYIDQAQIARVKTPIVTEFVMPHASLFLALSFSASIPKEE